MLSIMLLVLNGFSGMCVECTVNCKITHDWSGKASQTLEFCLILCSTSAVLCFSFCPMASWPQNWKKVWRNWGSSEWMVHVRKSVEKLVGRGREKGWGREYWPHQDEVMWCSLRASKQRWTSPAASFTQEDHLSQPEVSSEYCIANMFYRN